MARPSDVIENPVTGERMTFLKTQADTGGELLRLELQVRPHGFVLGEHIHAVQEERYDVREGWLTFKLNGVIRRAGPGERVVIPAGTRHSWWNAEDESALAILELQPALNTETIFETLFGLARDGKTNAKGVPGLLQLAVLVVASDSYVAGPPIWLQRFALGVLAFIARLAGYRERYAQYTEQA